MIDDTYSIIVRRIDYDKYDVRIYNNKFLDYPSKNDNVICVDAHRECIYNELKFFCGCGRNHYIWKKVEKLWDEIEEEEEEEEEVEEENVDFFKYLDIKGSHNRIYPSFDRGYLSLLVSIKNQSLAKGEERKKKEEKIFKKTVRNKMDKMKMKDKDKFKPVKTVIYRGKKNYR